MNEKIKILILVFSLFIIGIVLYIYYDITHIDKKNLINNDYLYLTYEKKTVSIKSKIIKNIINNNKNGWEFTIATYNYPLYLTDLENNINFKVGNDFIIINYKTEKYGNVQLISTKPFFGLCKTLETEFRSIGVR